MMTQVVNKKTPTVKWDFFSINYHRRRLCSMEEIKLMQAVCAEFNISPEQMRSTCKRRQYSDAKMVYSFLSKMYLRLTTTRIGHVLNLDHSTVVHKIKNMRGFIEVNDPVVSKMRFVEEKLFKQLKSI